MSGRVIDGMVFLRGYEMMEFKVLVIDFLCINRKKIFIEFLVMLSMGLCWGGNIFY